MSFSTRGPQRVKRARIVEVVVVASGCTDRTAEIVRERAGPSRCAGASHEGPSVAATGRSDQRLSPNPSSVGRCHLRVAVPTCWCRGKWWSVSFSASSSIQRLECAADGPFHQRLRNVHWRSHALSVADASSRRTGSAKAQ